MADKIYSVQAPNSLTFEVPNGLHDCHHKIEFLRVTPSENVVRINIDLEEIDTEQTNTKISYQYTSLSEEVNRFIEADLEKSFLKSMDWWEKAINHYLINGEMLKQGK